ncbi:MAG: hypothetical protein HS119_11590 [Flavobacteriales bacterium]|nr:hypothetical protein [Flavobacteriales bacterium]
MFIIVVIVASTFTVWSPAPRLVRLEQCCGIAVMLVGTGYAGTGVSVTDHNTVVMPVLSLLLMGG